MRIPDLGRSFAIAMLILALEIAVAAVTWALFATPGYPLDYYSAVVGRSTALTTLLAGPVLFVALVWLFAPKNSGRNAFVFAGTVFAFYLLVEAVLAALLAFFSLFFVLSLALKLAGALVGAMLARRRTNG